MKNRTSDYRRRLARAIDDWLQAELEFDTLPFKAFWRGSRTAEYMATAAFAVLEGMENGFCEAEEEGVLHVAGQCSTEEEEETRAAK